MDVDMKPDSGLHSLSLTQVTWCWTFYERDHTLIALWELFISDWTSAATARP